MSPRSSWDRCDSSFDLRNQGRKESCILFFCTPPRYEGDPALITTPHIKSNNNNKKKKPLWSKDIKIQSLGEPGTNTENGVSLQFAFSLLKGSTLSPCCAHVKKNSGYRVYLAIGHDVDRFNYKILDNLQINSFLLLPNCIDERAQRLNDFHAHDYQAIDTQVHQDWNKKSFCLVQSLSLLKIP